MNIKAKYNLSGIYQILNLINGKRYIGQASNIAKRIYEHKRKRNNSHLYKAIKKMDGEILKYQFLKKSPLKI